MAEKVGDPGGGAGASIEAWTVERLACALIVDLCRWYDAGGLSHGRSLESTLAELTRDLLRRHRPEGDIASWPSRERLIEEARDRIRTDLLSFETLPAGGSPVPASQARWTATHNVKFGTKIWYDGRPMFAVIAGAEDCRITPDDPRAQWVKCVEMVIERMNQSETFAVPARLDAENCTSFYHLWQGPPVGEPWEPDAYQSCLCGKLIWKHRSNATFSGYKTIYAARPGEEPPDAV